MLGSGKRILTGRIHKFIEPELTSLHATVLRVGRYRFYFFSNEGGEPPHIHVKVDADEAKFWLDPVRLAGNYGFNTPDLGEAERIVREHQVFLLEAWNERFS